MKVSRVSVKVSPWWTAVAVQIVASSSPGVRATAAATVSASSQREQANVAVAAV